MFSFRTIKMWDNSFCYAKWMGYVLTLLVPIYRINFVSNWFSYWENMPLEDYSSILVIKQKYYLENYINERNYINID